MDFFQAIITGAVQGLTEFLPVSSSGHLVLVSSIYKYFTGKPMSGGGEVEIFFDVMLHVGTLISLLIYFRQDLINVVSSFFKAVKTKSLKNNTEAQLPVYIMIATVATIGLILPLKDFFEANINNPSVVGLQIIITGVLLLTTEFMSARIKVGKNLNWIKAIVIGLAQGLAASPGISRSGSTIAAGLATGLDRVSAARFSFLLSIPVIVLAALYDTLELIKSREHLDLNWSAIIAGTMVSAVIGYYCIKYFITFLGKHKLNIFAYYCISVGLLMFLFFKGIS